MSTIDTTVAVGDRLANGATCLAVRASERYATTCSFVFLALWDGEFVTWYGDPDGSATTVGGYFGTDLADALEDFNDRP